MSKPLHVLIVEDSESDAAMVVHLLRKADYDIHDQRVESADQMQAALERQTWDLVISDYDLPQFNGPAALALIQEASLDIPFIVVSGKIDEETAVAIMRAGANDYLMKGKLTHLAAAVERELRDAKVRWGRKQAEEALQESEMRFRTLLENIPASVYRCEPTSPFRNIYRSDGIETISGFPVIHFIEKSMAFNDLILPEDLEMVTRALETAVAEKQPYSIEFRIRHADGSIRWVSEMGRVTYSEQGKPLWLDGVILDITERKQAEEALNVEQYLMDVLMDNVPTKIYFKDCESRFIRINNAEAQSFGLSDPGRAVGKTDFDFFSDEHAQQAYEDEQVIIETGQPISKEEKETWRDLPDTWVATIKMPLRDKNEKIIGTFGTSVDITERKRAEEALRESEAKNRAILEAIPDRVILYRIDGELLAAKHPKDYQSTLPIGPRDMIGKNITDLNPGLAPKVLTCLQQAVETSKTQVLEYESMRGDEREYREARYAAINQDEIVAIIRDITGRKRAEEAAKESEARYRSLFENVPVGIYRTTPDGRILMANPAFVQILGYKTFEDLAKRNLEENGYGPGYSRADFKQRIEGEGLVRGFEAELKRKDGSVVFTRESGKVIRDVTGQALYYEGTIEDITEFRRSELQNLRLVAAIEHAGETLMVSDQKGQIQYANTAFGKMFGIAADEVVGKNINFFSNVYQNSEDWQTILKTPRSGQVWRGVIRIDHADGMTLDIEATISPVLGLDKEVSSFVFVMRDVTQERAAEMQRRQSQKLEAIGQLAAGIAHEINTPTQFIGNNLRFLQNGFQELSRLINQYQTICHCVKDGVIPEDVLQETRAMAKQIDLDFLVSEIPQAIDGSLKGIERVTKIVSAMKEFSHPGTREKEITDINHAIENTIIVSRNEWKYAAEMVTDLDPELLHIPCLVDEFNQVILNLINNAADAVREAQSTRQDNEKGYISISTQRAGSWVIVKASDNGTGIPANIRERVFDPFFTTKEVGKGTGQGLLISYDVIVNKLGGKISFETEEGKGTTFIIHLPIEPIQEKESTDL